MATTWESWSEHRFGYLTGRAMLEKFGGTNSAIGGFMAGAEKHGFELIPTIFANAHPSGPTPRDVFDRILNDLLERLSAAGPVDGVILSLHGAMVAEGIDDGEGHILEAVRNLVGPAVPIVSELDIHTNMSPRMVAMADALVVHQTFPEIDQEECGLKCADIMHRTLREGLRPTMALHQLPMVWGMNQITRHSAHARSDRRTACRRSPAGGGHRVDLHLFPPRRHTPHGRLRHRRGRRRPGAGAALRR